MLAVYLGLPSFAAAEAIPGDFEAKVVLKQGDQAIALPVSVSLLIASPTSASPKFSGKVVSGTLTQSVTGSLTASSTEEGGGGPLVATVSNLKGIPPFTIYYTAPVPASDSDTGYPDEMILSFGDYGQFPAKPAATLGFGYDGKPWTLTDAFGGAFKIGEGALDALDSKIESIDSRLSGSADTIIQANEELVALNSELKDEQTALASVTKQAATLAQQGAALKKAEVAIETAVAAFETSVDKAVTSLSSAIVQNVPDTDQWSAEEQAGQVLEEFAFNFVLPSLQAEDGAAVLLAFSSSVKTLLTKTTLEVFNEALSEVPFQLPFAFESIAQAKALWTAFNGQTTGLINAAKVVSTAETAHGKELDRLGPDLLSQIQDAEASVQAATDAVNQVKASVTSKANEVAGLRAEMDSLKALKGVYVGAKSLGGFAGYGTLQAGVKVASSKASKPVAITAAFAGTAADGQKFTYSSKLRASEASAAGGVFFVNAAAGKRVVVTDVNYSIDLDAKVAFASPAEGDLPVWSGLELKQFVGTALISAKVLDPNREDFGRAMNIFGGPFDEYGNVSMSKTATSSVVVAVGAPTETGAISGFGAQVTNANVASKLLVAKKGSALKLTPSATTVPSFSGAFMYDSAVAKPFAGVFLKVEGESGPEVRGYGALVASPTASVAVEVYVSNGSEEGQQPVPPEVPLEPLVVWNGFTKGNILLQLNDMPTGLNVTTVRLFKGTKLVASAEATADGRVLLPTKGLVAGTDYTVRVSREFVSGVFESDASSEFEISARSLLAYTYQMLIGAGEGIAARNGMSYQGRLTVTTTATGSWTGKLEWVSLTQAVDSTGQPSSYTFSTTQGDIPVYIPAIVSYTLKGQLSVPDDKQDLSELRSTVLIPTLNGQPGHELVISILDGNTDGIVVFGPAPVTGVGLNLKAILTLDPSFGEENTQYGRAYPAVKAVAAAKGKYTTISLREDGTEKNNHTHTIDYAGAGTAIYTFQTGSNSAKLTSTVNVSLDGGMPFLLGGVLAKSSFIYQNSLGRNVSAQTAITVAGVMRPTLGLSDVDGKYWVSGATLSGGGCELEISTKSKGGYVLRDEWAGYSPSNGDHWGIAPSYNQLAPTKRYVDFLPEEKLFANTPYTFELVLDDYPAISDTITFDSKGMATFSDPASKSLVTLSATLSTGAAKAVVKLSNGELLPTGKSVTRTGFAMPGGSLLGWGGIEGGDVGWRIRAQ